MINGARILSLLIIVFSANAQTDTTMPKFDFFKNQKTAIKNPFALRDPFKRIIKQKTHSQAKIGSTTIKKGNIFSNIPSIGNAPLESIRIVGVLLGPKRRAMAKIVDEKMGQLSDNTYILNEGMKLGVNNAEVKAIVPGGIVVVEKVKNVYEQDEYLETIIPVTTE